MLDGTNGLTAKEVAGKTGLTFDCAQSALTELMSDNLVHRRFVGRQTLWVPTGVAEPIIAPLLAPPRPQKPPRAPKAPKPVTKQKSKVATTPAPELSADYGGKITLDVHGEPLALTFSSLVALKQFVDALLEGATPEGKPGRARAKT